MNAISMNNLWIYLSGLSMSAQNKRWLSDRLIESARSDKASSKADYVLRELDGCWANDSDAEDMSNTMLNLRKDKAREVEPMDD